MRWLFLFYCLTLAAEVDMPRGFFRGQLESVESGRIVARGADGFTVSCAFDSRTYMEADSERVAPARLRVGDPITVVADYRPGTRTCYARSLHVVAVPSINPRRTQRVAFHPSVVRVRGDRTIVGRVVQLDHRDFTLRTSDLDIRLARLQDTVYLGAGELTVNRRVSVRAGRNSAGGLDAYQVIWADMLPAP